MFALFLLGCAELRTITVQGSARATIEAGTIIEELLGDLGFEDFVSMELSQARELRDQGIEPEDIDSARLVGFELEALSGEGDLAFINSMAIAADSDALPEVEIASADSFPEGEARVPFQTSDVELVQYVVGGPVTLITDIDAHRPAEDTEVEATFTLDVTATVRGLKKAAASE